MSFRPPWSRTGTTTTGRSSTSRSTGRTGTDRTGTDRTGTDRTGTDRTGTVGTGRTSTTPSPPTTGRNAPRDRRSPQPAPPRYRPAHARGLSEQSRRRSFTMLVVMVAAFAAIAARLAYVQGPGAGRYLAVGTSEWTRTTVLPASRGSILDASGDELADSIPQTTVFADPHFVADPQQEAEALAAVLGLPEASVLADLTRPAGFAYVERTIPDALAAKVEALHLAGVSTMEEPKTFYPAGQLASPLLGTVGTDGTGLGGLEAKYDSVLQGKPGQVIAQTDPDGRQLPGGLEQYEAPTAGDDVVVTLDESLQYDAEQALAQAIVAAKAHSGIALLMDTKTGGILADANLVMPGPGNPDTTPAVPVTITGPGATGVTGATGAGASTASARTTQPVEAQSASAFTQVYEPGSVQKLITISAALQAGAIVPSDTFSIPNSYDVAGTPIHDAEPHATEEWNVTDILANSSNIGTIQIAQRLGRAGLLKYIHDYGEGQLTDIDFPGESEGLLPTYWSGTSIADVPIGQGIGVTAVQMLAAYNTLANGGVYVAPRLVDGIIGPNGREQLLPAAPTRRIVSTKVAAEMTTMLEQVVKVGTGTAANLSPYTVAGKTGTALVPLDGHYEPGPHYVASFAGFVPAEDPSITAMVMVYDTSDYGASASAPTFATIARDALQQLRIPPHAPLPPAPGVPSTNAQTATAAGESAGQPLASLATAPSMTTQATPTTPTTPSAPATPSRAPSAAPAATTPTSVRTATGSAAAAVGPSPTGRASDGDGDGEGGEPTTAPG